MFQHIFLLSFTSNNSNFLSPYPTAYNRPSCHGPSRDSQSTDLLLPPEELHFTTEQRELENLFWA